MKKRKKFVSMIVVAILCLGMMPSTVSAYEINHVSYVKAGTLDVKEDMFQWTDAGAKGYYVTAYDAETGVTAGVGVCDTNYCTAKEVLNRSGSFYLEVLVIDGNYNTVGYGYSEVFEYVDTIPPRTYWKSELTKRLSHEEAELCFHNDGSIASGEYYYAIVESGARAPQIDSSGKGIPANKRDNFMELKDLTPGAKDIYVVVKDQDGNVGEPVKTTIPAFEEAFDPYVSGTVYLDGKGGGELIIDSTLEGTLYTSWVVKEPDYFNPPAVNKEDWAANTVKAGKNTFYMEQIPITYKGVWLALMDRNGEMSDVSFVPLPEHYLLPSAKELVGGGYISFVSDIDLVAVEGMNQFAGEEENPMVAATGSGKNWFISLPNETTEYYFRGYAEKEVNGELTTEMVECFIKTTYKEPLKIPVGDKNGTGYEQEADIKDGIVITGDNFSFVGNNIDLSGLGNYGNPNSIYLTKPALKNNLSVLNHGIVPVDKDHAFSVNFGETGIAMNDAALTNMTDQLQAEEGCMLSVQALNYHDWAKDNPLSLPGNEEALGMLSIDAFAVGAGIGFGEDPFTEEHMRPITLSGELEYSFMVGADLGLDETTILKAYLVAAGTNTLEEREVNFRMENGIPRVTVASTSNSVYLVTYEKATENDTETETDTEAGKGEAPEAEDSFITWLATGAILLMAGAAVMVIVKNKNK